MSRKWNLEYRIDGQKKSNFWPFFCLLLFGILLKYPHVCQQANENRQQATDIAENRTKSPEGHESYQQIHESRIPACFRQGSSRETF